MGEILSMLWVVLSVILIFVLTAAFVVLVEVISLLRLTKMKLRMNMRS